MARKKRRKKRGNSYSQQNEDWLLEYPGWFDDWAEYNIEGFIADLTRFSRLFERGADRLLARIESDLDALSEMPAGSHLKELDSSRLLEFLPEQFLPRYTFDFVFRFRARLLFWMGRDELGMLSSAWTIDYLLVRALLGICQKTPTPWFLENPVFLEPLQNRFPAWFYPPYDSPLHISNWFPPENDDPGTVRRSSSGSINRQEDWVQVWNLSPIEACMPICDEAVQGWEPFNLEDCFPLPEDDDDLYDEEDPLCLEDDLPF